MRILLFFLASAACVPAPIRADIQQPAQAPLVQNHHDDDASTPYMPNPLEKVLSAAIAAVVAPPPPPSRPLSPASAASLEALLVSAASLFVGAVGGPAAALLVQTGADVPIILQIDTPPAEVALAAQALAAALRAWPTAAAAAASASSSSSSHAAFLAAAARISSYVDPGVAAHAADSALGPATHAVRALLADACTQEEAADGGDACAAGAELRAAWQAVVSGPVEAQLLRHD